MTFSLSCLINLQETGNALDGPHFEQIFYVLSLLLRAHELGLQGQQPQIYFPEFPIAAEIGKSFS